MYAYGNQKSKKYIFFVRSVILNGNLKLAYTFYWSNPFEIQQKTPTVAIQVHQVAYPSPQNCFNRLRNSWRSSLLRALALLAFRLIRWKRAFRSRCPTCHLTFWVLRWNRLKLATFVDYVDMPVVNPVQPSTHSAKLSPDPTRATCAAASLELAFNHAYIKRPLLLPCSRLSQT